MKLTSHCVLTIFFNIGYTSWLKIVMLWNSSKEVLRSTYINQIQYEHSRKGVTFDKAWPDFHKKELICTLKQTVLFKWTLQNVFLTNILSLELRGKSHVEIFSNPTTLRFCVGQRWCCGSDLHIQSRQV